MTLPGDRRCSNCVFWYADNDARMGECRRRCAATGDSPDTDAFAIWYKTLGDDGCGDHHTRAEYECVVTRRVVMICAPSEIDR